MAVALPLEGNQLRRTAELPPPVAAAIDAANAGDIGAFLASFTSGGVVDDWGREFIGPEQIAAWSEKEFIGVQVALQVVDVKSSAGETIVTAEVGGNGFNGPSHFVFRVKRERVSRMAIRA